MSFIQTISQTNSLRISFPSLAFSLFLFSFSTYITLFQAKKYSLLPTKEPFQPKMKSFIAATAVLALASSALAAPAGMKFGKRDSDPGPQAVIDTINAWNVDVQVVNRFLDTEPAFTLDYQNLAIQAFTFASNVSFPPASPPVCTAKERKKGKKRENTSS